MTNTELEVIDTAIKIGLGSLITLAGTFLITWLNHRNERRKEIRIRFYDSLENVSTNIEEITHVSLRYWALVIEWVRNNAQDMDLTKERRDELVKTKTDLFDQFKNLTVAESKLMLLGLTDISALIREYGDFLKEFRRKYYDGKKSLSENDMDEVRSELLNKRKAIFSELAKSYKKGI